MSYMVLLIWNIFIWAGTVFLVWNGWSPWWFILTLCITIDAATSSRVKL